MKFAYLMLCWPVQTAVGARRTASNLLCAGAELANAMNEAALEAARRNASEITNIDIYNGIDRILQVHRPFLQFEGFCSLSLTLPEPLRRKSFHVKICVNGRLYPLESNMLGCLSVTLCWSNLGAQGIRRPGLPARLRMRYCLAVHEVGRGLLATVLRQRCLDAGREPHLEAVERVTIVPRGQYGSH